MVKSHIGFEIRTLSNLIHRRINQMVSEVDDSLTAHHNWVLAYLIEHQEEHPVQKDIEQHFSIRRSTASHMLQLMEHNGYIERRSDSQDARRKSIVITQKGMDARLCMIARTQQFEEMLQKGFSPEELASFSQMLQRMAENISSDLENKERMMNQ